MIEFPTSSGPDEHIGPRANYDTPGGITLDGMAILRSLEAASGVAAPVEMLEAAARWDLAIGVDPARVKPYPPGGRLALADHWTDEQVARIGEAVWAGREAGGYAIVACNDYDLANLVKTVLAAALKESVST